MSHRISQLFRRKVAKRADFRCEYCLMPEKYSFLPFQIDHIISIKHGGGSEMENLAFACPHCNQYKGTDLTTFLASYQDIVKLFHPRIDDWAVHFSIQQGEIRSITRIGEATAKLLRFNEPERLIIRKILMEIGLYP